MNARAAEGTASAPQAQYLAVANDLPWVPLGAGKAFKPLRFLADDRGFVELLRLEPGVAIPLHRHSGEVHAYNLQGSRRLHTGELVGPGDYVYEPVGNTDSWQVEGNETLVVLVAVMGAVEYIGPDGNVGKRYDADTLRHLYEEYCASHALEVLELRERA